LSTAGIRLDVKEQGEVWGGLAGGLRRGTVYTGLTTASVTLDLGTMLHWDGATLFASAYQIHGRGPSANLVGNLQTVSNIEATRGTKLYALWLEQSLWDDRLNIRVGQAGANDEMMLSQNAALFLNSSFGYPASTTFDLPSGGPNYPIATPMLRVKLKPTDHVTVIGAVFNGDPAPPGAGDPQRRDASGTAFRVNDHALGFLELAYATGNADLPGTYKVGGWYHTAPFADQRLDNTGQSLADPASTGVARQHRGNHGLYAVVDQMLWHPAGAADKGVAMFGLVMTAPGDRNLSDLFVEAGVNWTGPFPARPADIAGFAIAYVHISRAAQQLVAERFAGSRIPGHETVLEATYQFQIARWWTLQPDVQYVINPGAGLPTPATGNRPVPLRNAWIVGLHGSVTF